LAWHGSRALLRLDQSQPPLAKDFEAIIASAKAFLYAACVMLLTRRLFRYDLDHNWTLTKLNATTNRNLISTFS
jgi:hypothetical protein